MLYFHGAEARLPGAQGEHIGRVPLLAQPFIHKGRRKPGLNCSQEQGWKSPYPVTNLLSCLIPSAES